MRQNKFLLQNTAVLGTANKNERILDTLNRATQFAAQKKPPNKNKLEGRTIIIIMMKNDNNNDDSAIMEHCDLLKQNLKRFSTKCERIIG